jgi:protein-tyrosine sulfotransferase
MKLATKIGATMAENNESLTWDPAFILSTGRSGSTLLRLIIDAHPEIACPQELHLASAFATVEFSIVGAIGGVVAPEVVSETVIAMCRDVAARSIGAYASEFGKSRWVEKSLPTIRQVELIKRVFPDARFICLYRDRCDTVMSVIEASRFGFSAFGVERYIAGDPTNVPQALARWWCDKTEEMVRVEAAWPEETLRLRYEDLVLTQPIETVARLFRFLGAEWREEYLESERVFRSDKAATRGD